MVTSVKIPKTTRSSYDDGFIYAPYIPLTVIDAWSKKEQERKFKENVEEVNRDEVKEVSELF